MYRDSDGKDIPMDWWSYLLLSTASDLLSWSRTRVLFKIIKPQIYLGGTDWSIRGPLLTSHPPCPVLMLAKCLLSAEAFCWNKQCSSFSGWDNLHCIVLGSSITMELRHWNIPPTVEEKGGWGAGDFGKQCVLLWRWVIYSFNQPCQKRCSLKMVLYLIFKLAFECKMEWHPCDTENK